jgi:hypothetical protein
MNPGGHEEVRASIPAKIFGSITQMKLLVHLRTSWERNLREGRPREVEMKWQEVTVIGAPSSLFNRGITQIPKLPPDK